MLIIKKLYASINNVNILRNINLKIKKGEIHILMGPNGSGKSTLSYIITGHPKYKINKGIILFKKKKINNLSPDKIFKMGIFLTFQNPIEIDGVTIYSFLKTLLNNKINLKKIYKICNKLKIKKENLKRFFNLGFSGGEKKKNEILQMLALKPKLIILDEIDSGLDIDSLLIIFKVINNYFINKKISILIITHNTNIHKYIKPNKVHIIYKGKIKISGNVKIIKKIIKYGYKKLIK